MKKFFLLILIFVLQVVALCFLPWRPSYELIKTKQLDDFKITLERSNGTLYQSEFKKEERSKGFLANKIVLEGEMLKYKNDVYILANNQKYNIEQQSEIKSLVLSKSVLFSITLFAITSTIIMFFLFEFFKKKDAIKLLIFLTNLGLLLILLYFLNPGFLNFDSFHYYRSAALGHISAFAGIYFSSILMVMFQLFPYASLVTVLSIILFSVLVAELGTDAYRYGYFKYFLAVELFVYLCHANLNVIFMATRESIATWILLYFLYRLLKFLSDENISKTDRYYLSFIGTLVIMSRPEMLVVGFVLIVAYLIKERRISTKITFMLIPVVLGFLINEVNPILSNDAKMTYKSTFLINPLSYILKKTYRDQLPVEVNNDLGMFFNNKSLIAFQYDYDIYPFHRGGVNSTFTAEEFEQFRNAAIKIILTHPKLFIENRILINTRLLGIFHFTDIITDDYFNLKEMKSDMDFKEEFGIKNIEKHRYRDRLVYFLNEENSMWNKVTRSYILPFIIIIFLVIRFYKFTGFKLILGVLSFRFILVALFTPAAYFKYQYPIYIFSYLAILYILLEKNSIRKVQNV